MTTARDIITLALKEATILGVGQSALAEDINDGLTYLQEMMDAWQITRWMVPGLYRVSMPGNDQESNTIGTGGYFNVERPSDIKGAYVVQLNTGQTPVSLPMRKIFSYEDYILIAVKSLASLPRAFFYDNAWVGGLGNVYVWPIPSSIYQIYLLIERELAFPANSLDTVIVLPKGYAEAIRLNLAIRMISAYQVSNPSPSTGVLAKLALNRIKKVNSQIPSLRMPGPLRARRGAGYGFNLWNPDGY